MPSVYGRDLDLNLLRVFGVVAETGSVTEAASRLYVTQPAVSAALRRLARAVGAPLFAHSGRRLVLTSRGVALRDGVRAHLQSLVDAALAPATFDPATSDHTVRLGLSDNAELWLLPRLLRVLEREAPHMRVIATPVQFRTVAAALATGLDAAISIADELPRAIRRQPLVPSTGHCCLYDPRHARIRRLTTAAYFAHEHVIVSYNGDLRGVIEDVVGQQRKIRCSVSTFANIGALIEGTAMLATIPGVIAAEIRAVRPHLRTTALPFPMRSDVTLDLLWPAARDEIAADRFVRAQITGLATTRGSVARARR